MARPAAERKHVPDFMNTVVVDRSRPLSGQIYDIVRLNIILEMLKPNDPINETDLGAWFGVSRTPVREAYLRLIDDGLIRTRNKVGTTVAPIDESRVREGIIIRRALEREVVRLICESGADLRPLDPVIALQSVAVSHKDPVEYFRQDEKFHATLAEVAGLPSAWRLAHSVKSHTDRTRFMLTRRQPDRMDISFDEHVALVDALRARDAELAQALVSKNINSAFDTVDDHAAP